MMKYLLSPRRPPLPPPLLSTLTSSEQGDMSLQEQAGLARKTLGAFGFNAITVSGDVCDELFVPSHPASHAYAAPNSSGSTRDSSLQGGGDTLEKVQERLLMFSLKARQERQERRWREQDQQQQRQLGVFKVGR